MPCGVIITRKDNIAKVEQDIEYLNSKDTTIMGSRNGQAPLFLWHTIQMKGKEGFEKDVKKMYVKCEIVCVNCCKTQMCHAC